MVSAGITGNNLLVVNAGTQKTSAESVQNNPQETFENLMSSMDGSKETPVKGEEAGMSDKAQEIKNIFEKSQQISSVETPKDDEIALVAQDAVSDLMKGIVSVITEIFDVTEEEVKAVAEALGADMEDLLTNNGLADIITGLLGKDSAMELLTDGQFSQMLKELYVQVAQLKETFLENYHLSEPQLSELAKQTEITEVFDAQVPEDMEAEDMEAEDMEAPEEMPDIVSEELQVQQPMEQIPQQAVHTVAQEQVQNSVPEEAIEKIPVDEEQVQNMAVMQPEQSKTSQGDTKDQGDMSEQSSLAQNFMTNLNNAFAQAVDPELKVEPEKVIRQVIEAVKTNITEDMTSMEMQLHPEHLGRISLQIVSRNGAITAQIMAQNEVAKEAIESQVAELKEHLNEQGIKVEAIEVAVGTRQFEENLDGQGRHQEEHQSKKHISQKELDEINGKETVQELLEEEIMKQDGNTVSIRA